MGFNIRNQWTASPDLMFGTEAKVRNERLKAYVFLGATYLALILSGMYSETEILFEILGILSGIVCVYHALHFSWHRSTHKMICKALAGLELHQYHCAEDLVFHMDMDWDLAEQIVNGEYDSLLMDKVTCKYIN